MEWMRFLLFFFLFSFSTHAQLKIGEVDMLHATLGCPTYSYFQDSILELDSTYSVQISHLQNKLELAYVSYQSHNRCFESSEIRHARVDSIVQLDIQFQTLIDTFAKHKKMLNEERDAKVHAIIKEATAMVAERDEVTLMVEKGKSTFIAPELFDYTYHIIKEILRIDPLSNK